MISLAQNVRDVAYGTRPPGSRGLGSTLAMIIDHAQLRLGSWRMLPISDTPLASRTLWRDVLLVEYFFSSQRREMLDHQNGEIYASRYAYPNKPS